MVVVVVTPLRMDSAETLLTSSLKSSSHASNPELRINGMISGFPFIDKRLNDVEKVGWRKTSPKGSDRKSMESGVPRYLVALCGAPLPAL